MFFLIIDLIMALGLLGLGLYFRYSGGRALRLMPSYRKAQTPCVNAPALCRGYSRRLLAWAAPFFVGAALDAFVSGAGFILSWAAFIMLTARHMQDMRDKMDARDKDQN